MTGYDATVLLVGCAVLYGAASLAEKLTVWLLWPHYRKLARQRLAHPEVEE